MQRDYAARARALVGVRFRPQGRATHVGVDCVGLVLATFGIAECAVRRNYRLRGAHHAELDAGLRAFFRRVQAAQRRPGDILLLSVASDQFHLAIQTDSGFVHADAKLGRVVETPGDPTWPIVGAYRNRVRARIGD